MEKLKHFSISVCTNMACALLISILLCSASQSSAQSMVGGQNDNFSWRLSGRVFFDGGFIFNDSVTSSFQVNDIRLGAQLHFMKNWDAKIELGYGDSKISLKDVFIDYATGNHGLRMGFHYEPFGNARVGTANFRFLTNAIADKSLGNKRKLGVSYSYNQKWFNFMGGIFSNGDIEKSKPLDAGYAFATKFVGRPLMKDKRLLHIGVAPRFSNKEESVEFSGGLPTDLLAKGDNTYVKANVDQVINQWKLDLELILLYDKWYFQGQYFLSHLNRFGTENYNATGAYAQAGYMIIGAKHNYNPKTGMIVNPAPKSLEALVRYDILDLNDGIVRGGRLSDITVGMNYFINKFVAAKINYTYMMLADSAPHGKDNLGIIQARLQFSF